MGDNFVDESRVILRELQSEIFKDEINKNDLFSKTLLMDNLLNKASIAYNKYLNEKK